MSFITDEELNSRLEKSLLPQDNFIIHAQRDPSLERKPRTEIEKVLIGALVQLDGAGAVARELPRVSPAEARNLSQGRDDFKNGADPNNPNINPDLEDKVSALARKMKDRISNLASSKLEGALTRITEDKLDEVQTARELSTISVSLEKVRASLEEKNPSNEMTMNIHLFRPRTKKEDEYEIIDVSITE